MGFVTASPKTITKEEIQSMIPSRKNAITDEIVEIINASQTEPEFQGESLLNIASTYEKVMQQNRVGIREYLNAIKFCAYLISMDDNMTEAYKRVFADRDFVKERRDADTSSVKYNELTSAASRYRRSKLVVDILTVSQVPVDLLFGGLRYRAIGLLGDIMMNSKYDRDRINAADKLLQHTASTTSKIELDIGVKESSAVASLQAQLAEMAAKQKLFLEAGATSLGDLGAMKPMEEIVEAEYA
jgi:hypothetical protein